jgi:hypothetical protein
MGDLEGLFACTKEEYQGLIGATVYFGEVLGKHSDVMCDLSEFNLTVVSDDRDKITVVEELIGTGTISGYNPLEYMSDED